MSRAVSDAYVMAINAENEQTVFHAEFGFVPPGAREGATLDASPFGQLWGSRLDQLNNRALRMGAKWGSLELNRATLGGGWRYIDPTIEQQTGDWSTVQSDANGVFATPPYIEMTLDAPYDLIGVQVVFDDLGMEWATEMRVTYYNAAGATLDERTFQNDRVSAPIDYQYNGVKKFRVTLNKWSLPRRFAKVCQVIPGQIRYFTDENLYSFGLRESISPFNPLKIPEFSLVFPNENQEYNIINPTGVVAKLRGKMEIVSQIGLVIAPVVEYVSTGNFLLFSWPDDANDETASFICRPDMAFANKNYVFSGTATQTVAQIAAAISTQAGLEIAIDVDATMQSIQVNANIGDKVPLQNAFGQLAIAAGGYVKFERDGSYKIKPMLFDSPIRTLDYNNMWGKARIVQDLAPAGVNVKYQRNELFVSSDNELGKVRDISSDFILNATEARRVGEIALAFFNNRLQIDIPFRGDMSIEAGDIVSVETDYGFKDILILEHEITYNTKDFLQGRLKGVGYEP